jgi:hypothetical protein
VLEVYDQVRARVLHLLLPHVGSVWRRARDWKWWCWQAAGATPVLGPLLWLLQLVLLDKRDEWQVAQFLAGFMASLFLGTGLGGLVGGASRMVLCALVMEPGGGSVSVHGGEF